MKEKKVIKSFCLLAIGATSETKEGNGFKRYTGIASSKVLAVCPNKKELDEIMGFESANDPEYVRDTDNGKEAVITFIVQTDPEANEGIDIKNRLTFILRNAPAYNKDHTKVQVIDQYGNHTWVDTETAKAGKKILRNDQPIKLDDSYTIACVGLCDLVDFLKLFLCVEDAFDYVNGTWVKKANADNCKFKLENVSDYFKGDFSELRSAIALQPNNKVKLLYGVRTNEEGKKFQTVVSKGDLMLRNNAGLKAYNKLENTLNNLKANGSYAATEFTTGPLTEYKIQATPVPPVDDAGQPEESVEATGGMPWD